MRALNTGPVVLGDADTKELLYKEVRAEAAAAAAAAAARAPRLGLGACAPTATASPMPTPTPTPCAARLHLASPARRRPAGGADPPPPPAAAAPGVAPAPHPDALRPARGDGARPRQDGQAQRQGGGGAPGGLPGAPGARGRVAAGARAGHHTQRWRWRLQVRAWWAMVAVVVEGGGWGGCGQPERPGPAAAPATTSWLAGWSVAAWGGRGVGLHVLLVGGAAAQRALAPPPSWHGSHSRTPPPPLTHTHTHPPNPAPPGTCTWRTSTCPTAAAS
jgi:hypothetical protein